MVERSTFLNSYTSLDSRYNLTVYLAGPVTVQFAAGQACLVKALLRHTIPKSCKRPISGAPLMAGLREDKVVCKSPNIWNVEQLSCSILPVT